MVVLQVQRKIEIFGEKLTSKWVTDKLTVSVTPDSITLKQWSDFWLTRSKLPEWFKEYEGRIEEMPDYGTKLSEYFQHIASLVACFCDKPELLRSLLFLINDSPQQEWSILALYSRIVHSIYTYEAKLSESFEFKGKTFVFPKTVIDTFGREWYGAELTTGEAIEALQANHVLNAVNEFGEYALGDRKYHTDIALLATLARKVEADGTIEVPPISALESRAFYDARIKFFSDAPMTIALDMAFFLKSSKLAYVNTLISQLPINLLQPR